MVALRAAPVKRFVVLSLRERTSIIVIRHAERDDYFL